MIALTKEKREELANYARERLASHVIHGGCSDEEDILKIALASLTAVPVLQIQKESYNNNVWIDAESEKEATANQCHGYKYRKLYPAPPVPEIKLPHELLDLINAVDFYHKVKAENPEVEIGAWNDAYDWIKKAAIEAAPVIKRLNGLGE